MGIAMAIVVLIAPFLSKTAEEVAKEAGKTVWERIQIICQAIRSKFAADKDNHAQETMQRLEEKPTDESRQTTFANVLAEKISMDPLFGQELNHLLQSAMQEKNTTQFLIKVYGQARVEKIINIAYANKVDIS